MPGLSGRRKEILKTDIPSTAGVIIPPPAGV